VSPKDKPLVWLRGQIKTPPMSRETRIEAGYLLRRLQRGDKLSMPHSRPMPNVGGRCHELRVGDANVTWRIVYRIDADAIVIAEVFGKKARTTPQSVIENCRKRLRSMTMRAEKRKRLEARGWKLGAPKELLNLSDEEAAYIELRLRLAEGLKARRSAKGLTQTELAKAVRSSQSRVAKMEAGDPTVSLDLLVKSLLALGASNRELARIIAQRGPVT
jgi:phage-related protein/DNA-binding XRE family transcriptional regulator